MDKIEAPKLKPRMKVFADEYLTGEHTGKAFNGRAAAEHAGYSMKGNPSSYASQLIRHPAVQAYMKERLEEYSMSAAEVMSRFTDIARAEIGDVVTTDPTGQYLRIDPDAVIAKKRFIKSFGFDSNGNPKIEFHDSHAALRDIARVRGMLKDGLEVSGPGGGAVPVSMTVQFVNPDGSQANPVPNQQQKQIEAPEDFSELEAFDEDE